jgi:PPOX class probable FMN-dependent enzyme
MSQFQINPAFTIPDETALRGLFEPTHTLAAIKSLDHLDKHARDFIARAPFLCIGTQNKDGRADVSPRGDPKGFVQILDDRTIAIPDRPGNNRLDTLVNILANPSVGLLFIIPGFDDTMRINGRAVLTTDPSVLEPMAVNDRVPKLAIVVTVNEVFIHCAKALRRSRLWDPAGFQDRKEMPTLMKILLDQTTGVPAEAEMEKADAGLEEDYKRSMY